MKHFIFLSTLISEGERILFLHTSIILVLHILLIHVDCLCAGSDVCRGMLLFDEKRPLGKTGLKWLKSHVVINLY